MRAEDKFIRRMDANVNGRLELSPLLKQAHEKANGILGDPDYTVQMDDFFDVYGQDNVRRDKAEVERLKSLFAQHQSPQSENSKVIAEILEAIMLMHCELSLWLGNATVLKTAEFDDFKNKTDLIAEWYSDEEGSRILALGVDVTFGTETADKKHRAIRDEIDNDKLGTIRYFTDTRGDFKGTRNNVPRVVIGVSQEAVFDLARLWMRQENRELGKHAVQRVIMEEISVQLELMLGYAEKKGATTAAGAYRQTIATLRGVIREKRSVPLGEMANDPVAREIEASARRMFT